MNKLPHLTNSIIITSIHSAMHRLTPYSHAQGKGASLKTSDQLDPHSFCKKLADSGYHNVKQVIQHGEFAHRGSIIDFFPMGYKHPIRIELFDDQIESLRSFNVDNQRTIEKIEQIKQILPAHEFPLTETSINKFRQNWRTKFNGNPSNAAMYQAISAGNAAAGSQYYLPLFFEQLHSFFDYIPCQSILLLQQNIEQASRSFYTEITNRHEQLQYDITRPICTPQELFLNCDEFFKNTHKFPQIHWGSTSLEKKSGRINYAVNSLPTLMIDHQKKKPLDTLNTWLSTNNLKILFCTQSAGRCENVQELLRNNTIETKKVENWEDFKDNETQYAVTIGEIEQGCILPDEQIAIISENELYGQQPKTRQSHRSNIDPDLIIRNLLELQIGSPVVHVELGVGRYQGLNVIKTNEIEAEYLTLEYANNDKVYIPIHNLHLILRYTGGDADNAPLQKLGSKQWGKAKEKAKKRATDVAAELLKVYSQRKMKKGFSFNTTNIDYSSFRQQFPFIETPDQDKAIKSRHR